MRKVLIITIMLLVTNGYAAEQGDTYIGIQYGQASIEINGASDDIELAYGLLRVGVFLTDSIALDGRFGQGADEDTVSGIDFEIERIAGLYALYHFNISENVSAYGLAGYSGSELDASVDVSGAKKDKDDFSYGIGFDIHGVNVEVVQYLDESGFEASAISIGYNYWIK